MKKDEFSSTSSIVVYMLLTLIIVYIFLLFIQPGRVYDVSLAFLPILPSIMLIVITLMYVKTTYKILKENQLFRKRTFIEEMIKKILFPLLNKLKTEINWFQKHTVFRVNDQKCDLNNLNIKDPIFLKHIHNDVFFKIFTDCYPDLSGKITVLDEKIPEFRKLCSDIINKINTKQFRDKWMNNANSYMRKVSRDRYFPFSEEDRYSKITDCILESVINKRKSYNVPDFFWDKYKEEILLVRDKNKKDFEILDKKTKEIMDFLEEIKNDVKETINYEQKKYGILAYS